MRNLHIDMKSSRHKKKRHHPSPEVCVISSESEFSPKDSGESEDNISLSSDSSNERIVLKAKKRRHKCKYRDAESKDTLKDGNEYVSQRIRSHHHEHKRHRRKEGESRRGHVEMVKIKTEPSDYHPRHLIPSHKRHDDRQRERGDVDRQRERSVDMEYVHRSHSSRHKHHRDDGSRNRERHHRSRDDAFHRGEASHKRRASAERDGDRRETDENKGSGRVGRHRWTNNEGGSSQETSRPVKQEPVSEDEPKFEWGKKSDDKKDSKKEPEENKSKPDFGLSGKLTEDTNTFNGVVIKYSEPPEARKPKRRWRLYPFKGDEGLPALYIHRQSCYLIGRDRKVADIPIDHPSCSKQHAALQYRLVPYDREDGTKGRRVRPYIIDLESSNGTFVNNVKVEVKKYIELLEKDVIKFGYSSREYVVLHEHSKDDEVDDDFPGNEETAQ